MSLDDQQATRRRKYVLMMGLRVVCLFAAAAVFRQSIWLALALMVGGMVLPWCAVLIANDRPPKKAERVARYRGDDLAPHALDAPATDPSPHASPGPATATPPGPATDAATGTTPEASSGKVVDG